MDNFSKLMADMLGKGQSLDEVARASDKYPCLMCLLFVDYCVIKSKCYQFKIFLFVTHVSCFRRPSFCSWDPKVHAFQHQKSAHQRGRHFRTIPI